MIWMKKAEKLLGKKWLCDRKEGDTRQEKENEGVGEQDWFSSQEH